MSGDQVHDRLPPALVRDVGRPDSREVHQHARGQMPRSPDARRHESQFTRLGLGQAEQFCDRMRRHVFVHGKHLRPDPQARDRRQVGQKVVAWTCIEMRIDRHSADVHNDERVAVWRAACRRGSPPVSAGTGAVLDHNELTQGRSQPVSQPARPNISDATRAAGDNDAYGLVRPTGTLCPQRGDQLSKCT